MKRVTQFISEDILECFYEALVDEDEAKLHRVHIPRSEVFYIREALEARMGEKLTLDRVERAMFLEGMLSAKDVFEPERKRDWE